MRYSHVGQPQRARNVNAAETIGGRVRARLLPLRLAQHRAALWLSVPNSLATREACASPDHGSCGTAIRRDLRPLTRTACPQHAHGQAPLRLQYSLHWFRCSRRALRGASALRGSCGRSILQRRRRPQPRLRPGLRSEPHGPSCRNCAPARLRPGRTLRPCARSEMRLGRRSANCKRPSARSRFELTGCSRRWTSCAACCSPRRGRRRLRGRVSNTHRPGPRRPRRSCRSSWTSRTRRTPGSQISSPTSSSWPARS